jgi:hypothetical protein
MGVFRPGAGCAMSTGVAAKTSICMRQKVCREFRAVESSGIARRRTDGNKGVGAGKAGDSLRFFEAVDASVVLSFSSESHTETL